MTGCQTCGGYGNKHDLAAHIDSGEDVRVTYAEGGYLPKMGRYLVHPDECIVTGHPLRCARPDHPTATSDCATEEES